MSFFKKIFKGNPLKRIELKAGTPKFRIRASRTGGLNAAIHPLRGLTFNTKHGLRVSKTFYGLTLGFQKKNTVVRGRWSTKDGLFNLNFSKSGFSLSGNSKFGSYNFKNPNRSSFKFAGIQLRGKNAKGLALLFLIPELIKFIFLTIIGLVRSCIFFIQLSLSLILFLFKLLVNITIITLKFVAICAQIIYELILFLFIDIPKQLFTKEYLIGLVIYFLRGIHWCGFLSGLITIIIILGYIGTFEFPIETLTIFAIGILIFFLSTGFGWILRYTFLEDCNFFPFKN